jgi:hypothetical protein
MNKKELKQKVAELISAKKSKDEVYKILTEQGENVSLVAYFIASNPNHIAYEVNYKKINILITFMFILALIGALNGYLVGLKYGTIYALFGALLGALFPLFIAYGFYKNDVLAYNIYILLSIVQLPQALGAIIKSPVGASIWLVIILAILAFVWHLRSRLFPDFKFIWPRKVNGQYVFTS